MELDASHRREVGRYSLYRELASGGMATVYLGRLNAAGGFGRIVAIKRLHAQLSKDPEFVTMFLDEARLAARIHHPNVVSTLDVVSEDGELFVVMEYIRGESLSNLVRAVKDMGVRMPLPIVASVVGGLLHGLHAAHEAVDERGEPLGIVHRDVSPQNVLVGIDGVSRVLDFGVAKAASRLQQTRDGQLKGKLGYMAPEQISEMEITSRCDLYAAGIVLWELLTGAFLFRGKTEGETLNRVLRREVKPPSNHNPEVSQELDALVLRALESSPAKRFATAREMAVALERTVRSASMLEVGEWVQRTAAATLDTRHAMVRDIESGSIDSLSGFPAIPAGPLAPVQASSSGVGSTPTASAGHASSATEGAQSAGTGARLVTAVTVASGSATLASARRPRRWPWLAGLVGAALLATGLLLGRQLTRGGDQGPLETPAAAPSAATTAAEQGVSSATPSVVSDDSSTTAPSASATAATAPAPDAGAAPADTAASAASPPPKGPGTSPRPKTTPSSKPSTTSQNGNDLDSLIENRR